MAHLKQYMIDTNVIRYNVNPAENLHEPTQNFWNKVVDEMENGRAVLFISSEVRRELTNQSFGFIARNDQLELDNIEDLLKHCNEVPSLTTKDIEDKIIEISAYVAANYKSDIDCGKGVKIPSVPDARILYTAWQEEYTLVTANIKDFMLLLLLDGPDEDRLLDVLSGSYITVTPQAYEKIHNDENFKRLYGELSYLIDQS